eukprot:CAMPEP_0202696394 /NCGR_PEP_ID=MMETSP1385-20130828/9684_1 /ASSEMBLY_ACC=CAM_ASM_000861 /TAXON_ID=933848 /ORGANISM="Elphidium margaritaceum" /LENGTH=477 /DNA_ID=CAMNT_0049352553 /DNA_START=189 /DNA_END=1622 /DNA_ORIENTATION=-
MANTNVTYAFSSRCCSLYFVDGETLNFFPLSFLFYMICHILLCCAMVVRILPAPFDYVSPKLSDAHSFVSHGSLHASDMFDRVLTYIVMVLTIWHCSFSFYQYSTTVLSSSSCVILLNFSVYAALFSLLFFIDVEFYFWLFPVVLAMHCVLDGYCTLKFSSVVIEQFKCFLENENNISPQYYENVDMLRTIYLVRRVSLMSCVLETISLGVLLIAYTADVIYYLPLLYSIKCLLFAYNFVRNRTFIQLSASRMCQCNKQGIIGINIEVEKCASHSVLAVGQISVTTTPDTTHAQTNVNDYANAINLSPPLPTFSATHSTPVFARPKDESDDENDDVPKLQPSEAPVSKSAHCVSNSTNQLVVVNGEKTLRSSFRENARASRDSVYNKDLFNVARIRSLDNLSFQFDIEDSDEDNAGNANGESTTNTAAKKELGIEHQRSNSLPIDVYQDAASNDVTNSFRMLSMYGFAAKIKKTTSI